MLSIVLFPEPLGPMRPTTAPRSAEKSASAKTVRPPNDTDTPRRSMPKPAAPLDSAAAAAAPPLTICVPIFLIFASTSAVVRAGSTEQKPAHIDRGRPRPQSAPACASAAGDPVRHPRRQRAPSHRARTWCRACIIRNIPTRLRNAPARAAILPTRRRAPRRSPSNSPSC